MVTVGDYADIIAEKMVFGGDCIAKIDGKMVFVPFAVPGEHLRVQIIADERDFFRARVTEILRDSPHRTEPFCPLYGKCGGCNMQHIEHEEQRNLRARVLKDAFLREGVETGDVQVVSGSPCGYRCRFQLNDGGLMERRSGNVLDIKSCPVATREINKYLAETEINDRPRGRSHLFASDRITSIPEGYDKIIIAEESGVRERPHAEPRPAKGMRRRKTPRRFEGSVIDPGRACAVTVCGKTINFDVLGFFQSNLEVLEKAVPLIMDGLGGKSALDLYAGCGIFSVFLADRFEKVSLVEHNKSALVFAEKNMAGLRHESFGVKGDVWVKYHAPGIHAEEDGAEPPFDAVVVDPPRQGMERQVCRWLCGSGIPRIRSLSCDTATHARDAKFLIRAGYRLEKLFLLDFYPQTGHIESLAYFSR